MESLLEGRECQVVSKGEDKVAGRGREYLVSDQLGRWLKSEPRGEFG